MATMRASRTSTASASIVGASRTPVAIAPMLTSASVVMSVRRTTRARRGRVVRHELSVLPETPVHQLLRRCPVVRAKHAAVHHRLGRRVEHLVLELAPRELGADEIPDELDQLDAVARAGRARLEVALGRGARLLADEARLGRRNVL